MKSFMTALLAGALMASAAGAQTIDRIKETGMLKLGYRTDAAPLSFATEEGNPNGYTPNVCVEVAQGIVQILKIENLDVEFVPVTTEDRFEKVAKGEIDLLCGASTITLARRNLVDFSIPVFADGTSVLLPLNGSESFADLAGKKLGVRTGTTTEAALTATLTSAAILADVVRFEDHASAMKAMEAGKLDAYFADQSILAGLWLNSPEQQNLRMGQNLLSIEQHGLAMARGDADFRLLVDAILSQLYAQGVMQKIFAATMPGIQPGEILRAMFTLAPQPQ